jgi:hypothetical protein
MRNRVHYENEEDIATALGDALAESAWPGVFAGGKQIVATESRSENELDVLSFTFNDGSQMNVVGLFSVRYREAGSVSVSPAREHWLYPDGQQLELEDGEE